jgi:hypothetical protein
MKKEQSSTKYNRNKSNNHQYSIGICLIICSFSFLSFVCCFSNSISWIYIENTPSELGNGDIAIIQGNEDNFYTKYFMSNITIDLETKFPDTTFLPRLYSLARRNDPISEINQKNHVICGINMTLESKYTNQIGNLWQYDSNLIKTKKQFNTSIPFGHCILSKPMALTLNATVGSYISLMIINQVQNLKVDAIVENDGRFPEIDEGIIIMELIYLQYYLHLENQVNFMLGFFEKPSNMYDIFDPKSTVDRFQLLDSEITNTIGSEFNVFFIRLSIFQFEPSQIIFLMILITVLILFGSYLAILSISNFIQEKRSRLLDNTDLNQLQEFEVKNFRKSLSNSLKKLCASSELGILLGCLIYGLIFDFALSFPLFYYLTLFILPILLLSSLIILRMSNRMIILNEKKNDTSHKAKQNSSISTKIGLIISCMSIFILIFLPNLFDPSKFTMVAIFFLMFSLLIFYIIFSVVIKIIPFCYHFLLYRFSSIKNKAKGKISKDLKNNNIKRQKYSLFLIALSLFFSIFSFQKVLFQNISNQVQFAHGGDFVIYNQGYFSDSNYINQTFLHNLTQKSPDSIISPVYLNFKENNIDQISLENGYSFNKPTTKIGDTGDLNLITCGIIGVDENFHQVIDTDLLKWDSRSNSNSNSLPQLNQRTNCCIISKSIAQELIISELNETIELSIVSSNLTRTTVLLNVIGISEGIPGFENFYSKNAFVSKTNGILINQEDYIQIMGYSGINDTRLPIDKIIIKLSELKTSQSQIQNYSNSLFDLESYLNTFLTNQFSFEISKPGTKIVVLNSGTLEINFYLNKILLFGISLGFFLLLQSFISKRKFVDGSKVKDTKDPSLLKKQEHKRKLQQFLHPLLSILATFIVGLAWTYITFIFISSILQIPAKFNFWSIFQI